VLTSLFFIITLIVFLAFDSARVARLAEGARAVRPHLVDALVSFTHGTRTYLGVSAVFGAIVAVIDTVLLYFLGVPGAFIWGVLAFVTNFIPNIGFVIGIIPPALVGLLEGGPGLMLAVIALYSLVNFVIQSLIQPRYVGEAVGLSTSLTFVSLLFWTWVLGPVGALLAVPMSLLFRAILVEADPDQHWRLPLVTGRPDDPLT
jgi:predicted PurR-regulated permease PerM